jgi:hypothetical protein
LKEANCTAKSIGKNLPDDKPGERNDVSDKKQARLYRVRLPGFITEEEIGLGDAVKRATAYLGIKPCGGCESRAIALNRWLVFSQRRTRWRIS